MKSRPHALAAAAFSLACLFTAGGALQAQEPDTAQALRAVLTGEAQVGEGDPEGGGTFTARIDADEGQLCYELNVTLAPEATAAHIHRGEAGENGRPVVTLAAPSTGSSAGCVDVEQGLLGELLQAPGGFYVNVHNAPYPGGAIRGQLRDVE